MKTTTEIIGDLKLKPFIKDKLKKDYEDALKDEDFSLLVSKLKVSKEVLINNTSTLEECAKNYKQCLSCKSIVTCPYQMAGYCYLPKVIDNNLTFSYIPCKFEKKLIKEQNYLNNIYLFDIPKEIKEARLDKIYMKDANRFEVIEWLHKFVNNYDTNKNQKGLYLYGNFGCGKTYLVSAMFNELAHRNVKSAIIYWPEYLRNLKSSFDTDFKDKFEYIKTVPLLLIDDIGAESVTSWSRDEILGPILQYRMQESLPTFFTSNLDIKALELHLSMSKEGIENIKAKRIIERISQLSEIKTMISKNLRK